MNYQEVLDNELKALKEEFELAETLRKASIVSKKDLTASQTYWLQQSIRKHFTEQGIDCFINVKAVGNDWVITYSLDRQSSYYHEDVVFTGIKVEELVSRIKPSPFTNRSVRIDFRDYSDADIAAFEQYLLYSGIVVLKKYKFNKGAGYELYRPEAYLSIPLSSLLENIPSSLIKNLQRERFKDVSALKLHVLATKEEYHANKEETDKKVKSLARYLGKSIDTFQSQCCFDNVFVLRSKDDFEFWEDN